MKAAGNEVKVNSFEEEIVHLLNYALFSSFAIFTH